MNPAPGLHSLSKLAEVENLLAAIVESSDDAIITKDLNGVITSWNKGAEHIFGYSADEMIGQPIAKLFPPGRENEEPQILSRLRKGERIDHYETIRRRKDGTIINISLTVSPVKDSTGRIVGASKIARDVTARHRGDNLARLLAAVVESSDDAIITKDLNGIITSWNKGAENIFGYTADEAIGKPVAMLIPPGRENEEPQILSRLRKGESIDHYETIRRRKDGGLVNIALTVSPIRDSTGVITGASKVARDVTLRKRIEADLVSAKNELVLANLQLEQRVMERTASLEKAIAQIEEFSYSVSHDLRAPVRAMKGFALALREDHSDRLDAEALNYLDRIITSGERMERLIHDVLTYSRVARSDIHLLPVSIDKLVPDIVQSYPSMQPPQAEIHVRHPLIPVLGHEPSLTQAISNLLANSVKFVAPGVTPKINIWTETNYGSVRLWVEDNGIGIPPQYQNRLFGMFERLNLNGNYEGTGIGLAIVRKSVEKMGGHVGLISDGQKGSAFWIELPSAKTTQ